MRWSDEHRRASFILIFLSHSPRYYLCSYFFSLFIMFCLPHFVFCFVSFFRYHLFWHQAFTTWQWWDNYFSTNSQKPRYFCFVCFFVWFNTKGFVTYLSDFMNIIFYRLIPIFGVKNENSDFVLILMFCFDWKKTFGQQLD